MQLRIAMQESMRLSCIHLLLFVTAHLTEEHGAVRDVESGTTRPEASMLQLLQDAFEKSETGSILLEHCFGNNSASKIFVAIVGSFRDGAVEILTPAQRAVHTYPFNGTVPEYLTTIVKSMSNVTTLLPWHRLCAIISVENSSIDVLNRTFQNIAYTDVVGVISNYLLERFVSSQTVLSSYNIPTLYFESSQQAGSIPADMVADAFNAESLNRQLLWEESLFSISPNSYELIDVFLQFVAVMGWENVAVILPKCASIDGDRTIVRGGGVTAYLSIFQPDNPSNTFAYMAQYELTIVLYYGEPHEYLDVLENAARNGFTGPGYVKKLHDLAFCAYIYIHGTVSS